MTEIILSKLLKNLRGVVDDVSEEILVQPIAPLVETIDPQVCNIKESVIVLEALKQIAAVPQGLLLVYGRGRGPRGVVTRSDLMRGLTEDQLEAKVTELLTASKNIVAIKSQATVRSALIKFRQHNFRRLPVFSEDDGSVIGVLKRSELLNWLIDALFHESKISA